MASSPTQRSLKLLRDEGYTAQVVERWNPHARVRQDLFGIIDIVAIKVLESNATNIVGVQTTSKSNMSARINKIKESAEAALWSSAGGLLLVHGWAKNKSKRWEVRAVWMHYDAKTLEWTQR
jgi:Holliday junction resolvase-like predicted endonuclease